MIEVRGLSYSYTAERPVLYGVDLTVRDGEWLALVGANGSGKSTLARQLNGLLQPTSGSVTVDGLSPARPEELWEIRARLAFVFQDPDNQFVATAVEDDVAFGPENLGLPPEEITRRVERALADLELTPLRRRSPEQLSGGEKQRVALAGALAMQPRYLVLDEPTSMLDPAGRVAFLQRLRQLRQERALTIVYITHLLEETLYADRVAVLDAGRIVREALPQELYQDYPWLAAHGLTAPPLVQLSWQLAERGHRACRGVFDRQRLAELLWKGGTDDEA